MKLLELQLSDVFIPYFVVENVVFAIHSNSQRAIIAFRSQGYHKVVMINDRIKSSRKLHLMMTSDGLELQADYSLFIVSKVLLGSTSQEIINSIRDFENTMLEFNYTYEKIKLFHINGRHTRVSLDSIKQSNSIVLGFFFEFEKLHRESKNYEGHLVESDLRVLLTHPWIRHSPNIIEKIECNHLELFLLKNGRIGCELPIIFTLTADWTCDVVCTIYHWFRINNKLEELMSFLNLAKLEYLTNPNVT